MIYQTYKNVNGNVDVIDELKFPVETVELPKINRRDFNFCKMKQVFLNTQKKVLIKKLIINNLVATKLF